MHVTCVPQNITKQASEPTQQNVASQRMQLWKMWHSDANSNTRLDWWVSKYFSYQRGRAKLLKYSTKHLILLNVRLKHRKIAKSLSIPKKIIGNVCIRNHNRFIQSNIDSTRAHKDVTVNLILHTFRSNSKYLRCEKWPFVQGASYVPGSMRGKKNQQLHTLKQYRSKKG